MAVTQGWSDRDVEQAPVVWRLTLRGVLVLDGERTHLLGGAAGAAWLALDEGPCTGAVLLERLRAWNPEIDSGDLDQALTKLVETGLIRS